MRIMLMTAGSRGDVVPFARLARRAIEAGHDVVLVLPDNSGVDVDGLETVSLGADYSALIEDQGVSPIAAMRSFDTVVRPIMRAVIVNSAKAAIASRPDLIVTHPKILSAPVVAASLGIPHVLVELVPAMTPTSAFPAPGTITRGWGPLNRLTYSAVGASARMFGRELSEVRGLLDREVRPAAPALTLMPVSPHILTRPSDWPDSVHLTGVWVAADGPATLPQVVDAFLDRGPVAYAGFGSMAAGDPAERARVIVEATRAQGWNLLLATGLGGARLSPDLRGDDVLEVSDVDHALALPRTVAAIHHGGIGTVQAAARAGVTSVVVPFIADQPFWGAQLHRAGLAPRPIPARRLTAPRLAAALTEVATYAARNREQGPVIAAEDGAAVALELLESLGGR